MILTLTVYIYVGFLEGKQQLQMLLWRDICWEFLHGCESPFWNGYASPLKLEWRLGTSIVGAIMGGEWWRVLWKLQLHKCG